MRLLFINPPHPSIGSRLAGEHLPPLGLLAVAGPLIDAGHEVQLLDADFSNLETPKILTQIEQCNPEVILLGHSGSTSAQPKINEITKAVRERFPEIKIVVGGVFPTFHWAEILRSQPQIDFLVRGEGEATPRNLINALEKGEPLESVLGIAYRNNGVPTVTPQPEPIANLDDYRIAWELTREYGYTYWGKRKAVVVQFSRGCPHHCIYCGQNLFWKTWRHRNPQKFADEIEMLHRDFGIEVFNFADENMNADPVVWRQFLEILIAKKLNLILVGSIRADSIVRDADFLTLYKQAGFERFLLGMEHHDESVLKKIKKGGTVSKDREAIQLLRKHGILSLATYVVGFGDETFRDFYRCWKEFLSYDPDQIMFVFATPHKWTPYFEEMKEKRVILTDQSKWDFKHQVLQTRNLSPKAVAFCVKLIELLVQMRPRAVLRLFFHKEARLSGAMRWYTNIGRRVWFWEVREFFWATPTEKEDVTVEQFWS